jgi:glycosyltransferase involved in cell wall biosynthesis
VAVAVPDLKEEYRAARHLAVIRNVPVLEMIDAGLQANPCPRELTNEHTIYLIYPGTLSASRGAEQMVRLMEQLDERYRLRLIGRWSDQELYSRCREMEGWRQVEYLGELRPDEVYSYLAASHIGLQLPLNTGNYQRGSLPVKVLEFMAAGLPVVLSDQPSKRRTFGDHALYVNPLDPVQAAAQVRRLGESAELRKQFARSGRDFAEHNSWERELQSLLSFYRELLA